MTHLYDHFQIVKYNDIKVFSLKNSFISVFFLSQTRFISTSSSYFCNTVSNKLHALAILIQLNNIIDIFIEIRDNVEKNCKNFLVPLPAFLLDFIKTMFHTGSMLFWGDLLCLFSEFINYKWHRITIFWQNFFNLLFFKIFSFLENCQCLAYEWFLSLLTTIPLKPPISC